MRVAIGAFGGAAIVGGYMLGVYHADCDHASDAKSDLEELSKLIPQTPDVGERVAQLIAEANQKIRTWEDLPLWEKIFKRLEVQHLIDQISEIVDTDECVKAANPPTVGTSTFSDDPDSDYAKRRAYFGLANSEE